MILIGVTGSIGTGKSTIASMLRSMGIPVHDSDRAVAGFLSPKGIGVKPVGKAFPESFDVDDEGYAFINKEILGKLVFVSRDRKEELENIIHPLVKKDIENFIQEMKKTDHDIIAFEIPLLFETGWNKRMDYSICVSCSPEKQKDRVMLRNGMTSEKFDAIVSGQMHDKDKRNIADYVVMNDGEMEETRRSLEQVIEDIKIRRATKTESISK